MAGSLVVAVKQALIDALQGMTGDAEDLEGVAVRYAYRSDTSERERIWTGRARATHTPSSLKSGRMFRDEDMTFDLTIVVEKVGGTAEDAEDRAIEIGTVVEEYIADNKTLGVAGVKWVRVASAELTPLMNDRGAMAELVYSITYQARLT